MSKIKIIIKGIAAELALGSYLPSDKTIYNNWEDFYKYNDVLHSSQLIADYISEIEIHEGDKLIYKGKIPAKHFIQEKSFLPNMIENGVYLRTECVENATYETETEIDVFDISKLTFSTQDYELIFKSAKDFVTSVLYDNKPLELIWVKGEPVGNICLLCGFRNGFLVPLYDAITKKYSKNIPK